MPSIWHLDDYFGDSLDDQNSVNIASATTTPTTGETGLLPSDLFSDLPFFNCGDEDFAGWPDALEASCAPDAFEESLGTEPPLPHSPSPPTPTPSNIESSSSGATHFSAPTSRDSDVCTTSNEDTSDELSTQSVSLTSPTVLHEVEPLPSGATHSSESAPASRDADNSTNESQAELGTSPSTETRKHGRSKSGSLSLYRRAELAVPPPTSSSKIVKENEDGATLVPKTAAPPSRVVNTDQSLGKRKHGVLDDEVYLDDDYTPASTGGLEPTLPKFGDGEQAQSDDQFQIAQREYHAHVAREPAEPLQNPYYHRQHDSSQMAGAPSFRTTPDREARIPDVAADNYAAGARLPSLAPSQPPPIAGPTPSTSPAGPPTTHVCVRTLVETQPKKCCWRENGGTVECTVFIEPEEYAASNHVKDTHAIRKPMVTDANGEEVESTKHWICDWSGCGKAFSNGTHLYRHLNTHTNFGATRCTQCGSSSARSDSYKSRHRNCHQAQGNKRRKV